MTIDAQANLRTLRDVLRYAVTRFNESELAFGHGQADAFEEAAFIVMRTLQLPLQRLDFFADAYLTHGEINGLLQSIERRVKKRMPAAYLLNEAWLQGYKFYVDERVIIPRTFIAELLHDDLHPWVQDADAVTDVLDLCTAPAVWRSWRPIFSRMPRSMPSTRRPKRYKSQHETLPIITLTIGSR